MWQFLHQFLVDNQDVIWGVVKAQLGVIVAISIAKLPDPRKFEGKRWAWLYDVFFAYASRASATRWDEKGGHLKLPGFQVPNLKDVPHPHAAWLKTPAVPLLADKTIRVRPEDGP